MLDEEIYQEEVEDTINEAYEISALGLLEQTINLFKLIFQEIPGIFTAAINKFVFSTELLSKKLFL
jgi:hypothetical protein